MGPDSGGGTRRPRLLGVFAHPDDETFCAGGTFARYAKDGAEIMVVSATRGQAGQIRDARVGTRRTIGAVREAELRLACERLGVAHTRCWDYLDGCLAEADFTDLVGQVVQLIRGFKPEVVVSFGPDGAYGHPDHVAISAATTAACQQAGDPARYPGQLAGGLAPHQPGQLYHAYFPPRDVLLMDRLAAWLITRPDRFAGTMEFVHALLLMAEEAVTMGFIKDHAQVRWYPTGLYVVEQGEAATELFMILSGHADVWQEQADGSLEKLRHDRAGRILRRARRGRPAGAQRARGGHGGTDLPGVRTRGTDPVRRAGRGSAAARPGSGPTAPRRVWRAGPRWRRPGWTSPARSRPRSARCAPTAASSRSSRACSLTSCSRNSSAGSTSSRCCRRVRWRPNC